MNNIERFEEIMSGVQREGIDKLMEYIRGCDFYTAPASTKFHLCVEGGLLQHSLNVYDCLMAKKNNPVWKPILEEAGDESLAIISLLHDLCKTNFYTQKCAGARMKTISGSSTRCMRLMIRFLTAMERNL